jgi:hypothetical protein
MSSTNNVYLPARMDIRVHQEATFMRKVVWKKASDGTPVVDLTQYTAKMVIKPTLPNKGPVITLTELNGGLIIDAVEGSVTINITPVFMDKCLPSEQSLRYGVYDLLLVNDTPGGPIHALLKGDVIMTVGVTKS